MQDTRRLAGAAVAAGLALDPWRAALRRPDGAEVIPRPGTFEPPAAPHDSIRPGGAGVTFLTRHGAACGGGDA
jgi:hypothetical protein